MSRNQEHQQSQPLFETRRDIFIAILFVLIPPCIVAFIFFPIYRTYINPSAIFLSNDDNTANVLFLASIAIGPFAYVLYSTVSKPTIATYNSVVNRLIIRDLTYKDIIQPNPSTNPPLPPMNSHFHFSNSVLAYISPGCSRGYELAKNFTSKFTHISPMWYELNSVGKKFFLEGRHNANMNWISELRKKGDVKLLPRVVINALPVVLLKEKKQREKAIALIVDECRRMAYDGVVLESWIGWASHGIMRDNIMREKAIEFIGELGNSMHSPSVDGKDKRRLDLIYVIHPSRASLSVQDDFGRADLRSLSEAVDGFSLVLYDFSSADHPGPNAPLQWISATLHELLRDNDKDLARKTFFGLNFNGRDYLLGESVKTLSDTEYKDILEEHCPQMGWDERSGEHYFIYLDNDLRTHTVFYPSQLSVWIRLEIAQEWGAGVALHQVGQGFDYFLGLL